MTDAPTRPVAARGLAAVAAAAFLWATLSIVGKALYATGAQPMVVVAWRAALAALALAVVLGARTPRRLRVPARELPFFALFGLVAAGNYASYFLALRHVPVAVAIILLYTYPALVAVAARPLFGEIIGARRLAALAVTFAGVILVAGGRAPGALRLEGAGILLGLGAAATMAAYSLLGRRAAQRFGPWTSALYVFAFAALWLAAAAGPLLGSALTYAPVVWAGLAYIAVGPTLLAYGLFLWALARVEVSRASIWTTLEPPMAAALAFVVLGETVDAVQIAGGVLVLIGVVVLQWPRRITPAPA